jgi:hypothetical protein
MERAPVMARALPRTWVEMNWRIEQEGSMLVLER